MDKLLTEQELRDSIRDAITGIDTENENNLWTTGQIERIETLIQSQKKAHGDMVIGEDLLVYGAENEAGDVSLDSYMNSAVNSRLAEQRERNK